MKLRLSQHLKTAILAAMAAVSSYTYADTILISDGINKDDVTKSERFYDTGKGYYFSWYQYSNYWHNLKDLRDSKGSFAFLGDVYERMPANTTTTDHDSLTNDANTCWAQVSMNMVEYWHSYYGVFCNDSRELTYGLCYDKKYLDETGGTLSLKQNLVFLDTFSNTGDNLVSYLNWILLGDDDPYFSTIEVPNQGGYWTDYFTTSYSTRNWYSQTNTTVYQLTSDLLTTLGYVKNTDGTYTQSIKGQIAYISMDSTDGGGHGITCHGVLLDENGKLKALYVTNSDDREYKLFKLYIKQDATRHYLYTNEKCTELWEYSNDNWYIDGVGGIRTPKLLQDMLAEYEDADNALVWTGNTAANGEWDLTAGYTSAYLPDETTGWHIEVDGDFYAAFYDAERIVRFDDSAKSGKVSVTNSGTAHRMELNNKTLDYSFTGTGSNTLTVDTLVAANGGKTSFQKLQLTTTEALINNHTISMGNGAKWMGQAQVAIKGTVELAGGTLALTKLTLNGGTLSITGNGNTLASGAISSSNGATLLFTPTGTTTTPMLTIGSGVSFSGSALDIAMGGEGLVFDTTYALISFENAQTDWQKLFTTEQGEFTYTNHILYLIYNPVPKLTWSGTTGTWSSERWGSTTTGTNDLRAEFTGSGTRTVTISGTVRPYSITVDNSGAVTFNGSGNISGNGVLKKSGNGSLTINTANNYSGGTAVSGGTLTVGHASALGSGDIALSGGTLNLASKSVSNTLNVSGNATINGGSAYNGTLVLADGHLSGEALRLGKNATVQSGEISNVLTGTGKISKSGSGTVTLSGANTYSGGTSVTEGTLIAGNAQALGSGAVTLSNATLNMGGYALSNSVTISSGKAFITNADNYTGNLKLNSGTLTTEGGYLDCGSLTLNGGIFLLDNSNANLNAPLVDVAGTLSITAATQIGFTGIYGLGTYILFDFVTLEGNISNLTLMPQSGKNLEYEIYRQGSQVLVDIRTSGALLKWQGAGVWCVGGGSWQQGKVFEQGDQAHFTQAATVTLQGQLSPSIILVDSNQDVTFSGTGSITNNADLTKKGQGQLQLNAANPNWTGNIYLQGGTITATGNTSFGKGDIHATSNATLNLGGKVIDNDIYISNGATVGILGGNKFTGSVDVTGNLAVKSTLHIAEGESITLHSGKHSATVTGKGTMRIEDGSVTLQTGKYTMSQLDIASKLTIMKQGLALAKTDSFITITEGGSLVSSGNISGCHLSVWDGSINIRNSNPVNITLNGDFTAENSSSIRIYGALKSDSFTLNQSTFKLSGEKPQAITIKKGMSINGGTGFSTNGNVTAAYLEVNDTKFTIDGTKAAALTLKDKTTDTTFNNATVTLDGKLTATAGLSLTDSTLSMSDPSGKNAPQALSVKGALSLADGSDISTNGKVSAASLEMKNSTLSISNIKPQSLALTGKTDALKQPITSHITNSTLLLNGSMSVAANMELNNATIQLKDANTTKPKALAMAVKGDLTLGGKSQLFLSGALSAKNLTLGTGSIYMTGEKQQTIKVSNELTLNGGTELNLGFSITQKDFDKNKAFKILTFKVLDTAIEATDLYSLLGLSEDICTLDFDKSRKSITLVVDDMDAWNNQAEAVRNKEVTVSAATTAEAVEDAEEILFAPTTDTAELAPELAKAADTLVQSTWGTVGASRAFGETIANRGTHATLLEGGKGAAWISTMGGSSRISSEAGHAGADYTLTGAAFGIEAHITDTSVLGLAVGNSWGKVSTFSAYPVDQDSTHAGIYGNHKLGDTLSLSWMAAHTRTESDVNLAGMPCTWSQDALQLDARLTWAKSLNARTTVNAFGGLQYLATESGECNGIKTGSLQNLRAEIGVGTTHRFTGDTMAYGELSFIGDVVRNNPTADLGVLRSHGTNPGRAGMNLSVGATHRINDDWSVNATYNLELMQNITSHGLNAGATYSF